MLTIIQQLIIGTIQGITEWLPLSSSGIIILIMSNLFGITEIDKLIHTLLFLHLGTFFAALIYFRKEVIQLFTTLFKYKYQDEFSKKTLKFLIISTLITSFLGLLILKILILEKFEFTGKTITFLVGILLLFTGIIQIKIKKRGLKRERSLENKDGILLGIAQSFASFPGISRSGITISILLLRKFDDTTALRLSFLMSLPIILFGNIFLNFNEFIKIFSGTAIYGLLASFVFGLLTISGLMKFSRKINFGWFVLIFALLMIASVLI
jgi:undecaprenyl-diphosphatase